MADRYWVGGAGSWNTTAKWSTTSGGASGASVPTSADNAIFDAASGAAPFTATVTDGATCANLTLTPNATVGVTILDVAGSFVIAGTFSTSGTAGNRRHWIRSATYGIMRDVQIATIGTVTDVDFRDVRITGAGGTLSGTRIGNLRGCSGITFDTPKTVYWNQAAGGNWSGNNWAASSGAGVSTDNFPLAQDTATFVNTGLNNGVTVNMDTAVPYTGTIDMSGRTGAMTLNLNTAQTIYGNWINGSGTTLSGGYVVTFSGRNTQTITSAGKTFNNAPTVDSYGGTVELADALTTGGTSLTVTNGTFDTKNFNVTASDLSSSNSNVRTITLGSSTVTLSGGGAIGFATSTNLTFNAGTSTISIASGNISAGNTAGPGITFYNVTWTAAVSSAINGVNTFNNITFNAPAAAGFVEFTPTANQTITGTLTVAGASPVRRIFVRSSVLGTTRTLSVGTLSATDCDFRDIAITGAAAGSSPTRAGDCGGNSGITFPAGKTVYWNLAGAQNWSATGWASSSGGAPDINNFPLAQDTAVFDNTGSVTGTITIDRAWNIGTFDASLRTSGMTLTTGSNAPFVYGDWKFGTGVTNSSAAGQINFGKRGTQTITSNGVQFGSNVYIDSISGTVQLADALSILSIRLLVPFSGTFDAVTYNVTVGTLNSTPTSTRTIKMGSGTWTMTSGGTVWTIVSTGLTFYKGTANIVLSDTGTTARAFDGGGLSYNKLTIGGATGTSTLTISSNNQFTELASTKTVAHTIALGSTTQTFGKWTVTGTAGNVVTLTGTGTSHILAGACTSGIDYLAMGSIGFASTSPGEFYAGANSTATSAVAPVYLTAKPADGTRYWVGGTGNWSSTTKWSTSSGGASGASIPRSHDDVIFDSASNAIAYTATVDAVTGGIRMKSLTIAGPLVGNVTLAGSAAMVGIHGNVTLPATGLTRTYTGTITLSSNSTGLTFTTNGVALASVIQVNGTESSWSLGSALNIGSSSIQVINGSINFSTYNVTAGQIFSSYDHSRTINLSSGTFTSAASTPINFGTTETARANLTVTAGTSQINCSFSSPTLFGNNQTFYNVSFTATSAGTVTLNGANSFNNLSFTGITAAGLKNISLSANQTVTGTLTFSAGTDATMRHFVQSNTIGTTRTITAAAVSMTDVDFRDITIAGAAAPASGTRIGDCKGNSGITFTGATTRYWNLAGGGNWSDTGWASTSGGAPAVNNFPLAQDTAVFQATGLNSGATVTVNQSYNIGTIDMSARTTNTMTLATGTTLPVVHGNWVNGTGTTLSGTQVIFFGGRGSQSITSAGKTFTQQLSIFGTGTNVVLQDALIINNASSGITLNSGTFDAVSYNVSLLNAANMQAASGTDARVLGIGSGTWTVASSGASAWNTGGVGFSVTGTGTISLTSASAKTFGGGGVAYTNITLNQGGAGTLTITGNNTFKTISNTSGVANTINIGTTTQTITTSWTAAGTAGNVQTVSGTSASSPGTLVFSGSGQAANVDYLAITGIRAYSLTTTWYAGANSTNNGSLGWIFAAAGGTIYNVSFSDTATGADAISATATFNVSFSDTATGLDAVSGGSVFSADFSDSATGADAVSTTATLNVSVSDTASGLDAVSAGLVFSAAFADTASGADSINAGGTFNVAFSDTASGADAISATATLIAAFSDAAAILDAPAVAASIFNVTLDEVASGLDSVSPAGSTFNVSFSDTGSITDLVVGGYLWNPIDDTQTANWQNVVTAPATTWVDINDAQSPGWVQIQT